MVGMNKTFTFWTDPGHGWLEVTIRDLIAVGMKATDFSEFSYKSGNRVFLEEDCDAPLFLKRCREIGRKITVVEENDDTDSFVRGLPHICKQTAHEQLLR